MIRKSYVEDLQLFVDYMNIKYKCIKFTSKTEHDSYLSFQDIKLPVITKNLKHLLIENQILVVPLGTMKVI